MRARHTAFFVAVASLALGSGAIGQPLDPDELPLGSRVRLTTVDRPQTVVGTVVSANDEAVVVRLPGTDDLLRVPASSLRAVEVARSSRWKARLSGMLTGAGIYACAAVGSDIPPTLPVIIGSALAMPASFAAAGKARKGGSIGQGMLAGALVTSAIGALGGALEASEFEDAASGEVVAIGAGLGAVFGAVVGGVSAAVGHERWAPARHRELRVSLRPVARGMAATVQVSF